MASIRIEDNGSEITRVKLTCGGRIQRHSHIVSLLDRQASP